VARQLLRGFVCCVELGEHCKLDDGADLAAIKTTLGGLLEHLLSGEVPPAVVFEPLLTLHEFLCDGLDDGCVPRRVAAFLRWCCFA
jgi:hypothetical protein